MSFSRILRYLCCMYNNVTIDIPNPICIIDYTETIPFIPPIEGGRVIKVYDGDTITIASKLPYHDSPLYRFQVRLRNIDCPEIKGKTEDEIEMAQIAKKELEKLILHKYVNLKNIGTEKYGRILADVYIENLYVNDYMLENKLAILYNGKTKIIPVSWKRYHLTGEYK